MGLFTRPGDNPLQYLRDMQCSWHDVECGDMFARQGKLGLALKKYLAVDKYFQDIFEDQLDFNAYCSRKGTLRSWIEMVRYECKMSFFLCFVCSWRKLNSVF